MAATLELHSTLNVDPSGRTCPVATFLTRADGGVDVVCGVIERANRREPTAEEVPALIDGRKSVSTIACFCAGQGIPGPPKTEALEKLSGLTLPQANALFTYTDCPVWTDEQDLLERVRREGQSAKLEAAGVERVDHGPSDRPDGPAARAAA